MEHRNNWLKKGLRVRLKQSRTVAKRGNEAKSSGQSKMQSDAKTKGIERIIINELRDIPSVPAHFAIIVILVCAIYFV